MSLTVCVCVFVSRFVCVVCGVLYVLCMLCVTCFVVLCVFCVLFMLCVLFVFCVLFLLCLLIEVFGAFDQAGVRLHHLVIHVMVKGITRGHRDRGGFPGPGDSANGPRHRGRGRRRYDDSGDDDDDEGGCGGDVAAADYDECCDYVD